MVGTSNENSIKTKIQKKEENLKIPKKLQETDQNTTKKSQNL